MEEIKSSDGYIIAIIVKNDFRKDGYNFLSKEEFPLQLGINTYKCGQEIKAHVHKDRLISIDKFQEIVYLKSGKLRVHLYDQSAVFVKSVELSTGDLIFLASGGHGFEILEDTTIIEVKQGPYLGKNQDKMVIE